MTNEKFWELVDSYERKDITDEEAIKIICAATDDYLVAYADYSLLVRRVITTDEKKKMKELLNKEVPRG